MLLLWIEDQRHHLHDRTVNDSDVDVVFRSSDGVQLEFHLHRKNLETGTGIFPGPEFETKGEITNLAESADVLQILKFVYPRRHPDLEDLDFSMVTAVAEAIGKCSQFYIRAPPASGVGYFLLSVRHSLHNLKILHPRSPSRGPPPRIKHDHPKLINEAAPLPLHSLPPKNSHLPTSMGTSLIYLIMVVRADFIFKHQVKVYRRK